MRQPFLIALTLVALALPGPALRAGSGGADGLDQARMLLRKGEYQRAAAIIEDALPASAPNDRVAMLELLRQAYRMLISRAEAAGRNREADEYRDNLAIIDLPRDQPKNQALPIAAPAAGPEPPANLKPPSLLAEPATELPPVASRPSDTLPPADAAVKKADLRPIARASSILDQAALGEPSPLPDPGPMPPPVGLAPAKPAPALAQRIPDARTGLPARPSTSPVQTPADSSGNPGPPAAQSRNAQALEPAPVSELSQADRLFLGKKYAEAGRIYARLAAMNQLPVKRHQVWAYCRWVSVVARINAPPKSDREWDEIEQEIRSVQRLVPGNWYGEYLQNRVTEARRAAGRSGKLVVRGSAPDDSPPSRFHGLLNRSGSASGSPQPPTSAAEGEQTMSLPSQSDSRELPRESAGEPRKEPAADDAPSSTPLSWHVHESANFRVYHVDATAAARASQTAEEVRSKQAKRWGSIATRSTWSPKCEIYLYPTPKDFARMTGQPETSPGFSTMGINGNRIIARRVNLRADHPQLLTAILPHEVTHVVLADLFTEKQIPRWADEGMAVLAEPISEQLGRASDLAAPLEQGRLFKLSELMAIDYPNAEAWGLYYAQSVSLTQFLVEQSTPEQFVSFVRAAQREGVEQALRELYHIEGFPDLETRWRNYARRQIATITASKESRLGSNDSSRRE